MAWIGNPLAFVKNSVDQLQDLQASLNNVINLTTDITQELFEFGTDIPEEKLETIKGTMLGYLELQKNISNFQNAFNNVKQQTKSSKELPSNLSEVLMENYSVLNTVTKDELMQKQPYKRLLGTIQAGSTATPISTQNEENNTSMEDSDIVATQEEHVPLDPLTRKEIEDPVRNKICKHIYERTSIMHFIAHRKNNARCPMIACSNVERLHQGILEDDTEARRIIQKKKRGANSLL